MLPYIQKCPSRLRRELLSGGCARCGGKGCGKWVTVSVDGEEREVCHYGIFRAWHWSRRDLPAIKRLLETTASFFDEEVGEPS